MSYFDRDRLDRVGYPALIDYYRSGHSYRFSVLREAVQYFYESDTVLADVMMEAIQESDLVQTEVVDVRDLGRSIGYSNSQQLATRAFAILLRNPNLADRPGFIGLFHGVLAKAPFARGSEFCQNLIEASRYKEKIGTKLDSRVEGVIARCLTAGE